MLCTIMMPKVVTVSDKLLKLSSVIGIRDGYHFISAEGGIVRFYCSVI